MAITVSILTGGSSSHQTTSEEGNQLSTDFISEGVVGAITNTAGVAPATGSFAVNAQGTPDMTVAVSAGTAYTTATPSGQGSQTLRIKNSATSNVTISANSSGSTKYDWIYISVSAANAANPNSAADNVATLVASRSSSATSDDGTPPTYGTTLAVVTVANGASSITNGNIADARVRAASVGGINDSNGNEVIKVSAAANAVNEFTVANAATGNHPALSATGSDSNINIEFTPKGTGKVTKGGYPIDWWQEIGRTTLGSAGDTITISSLPARKYLLIQAWATDTGGTVRAQLRFNNDSGSNYSFRNSINGGADGSNVSQAQIDLAQTASAYPKFSVVEVINVASAEKLVIGRTTEQGTAGAGNAVQKIEFSGKWANTAVQISRVDVINVGTGDFATGSEVIVLGHD